MLVLLSPAKNLDLSPAPAVAQYASLAATAPALLDRADLLAKTAKRLKAKDLKALMDISDELAALNAARFASYELGADVQTGHQAAFTFAGDVYRGLDARSLSADDLIWAQDRLRILSGLYGVLRPLDAIQPYRLEMGTKIRTRRGETLYDYWGADLAKTLNRALDEHPQRVIVNLASDEYFKAVDRKALKAEVIAPAFKDVKDGKARSLFMFVKRARGLMARWIIENRIDDPDRLKSFAVEGYRLDPEAPAWTFCRPQPAAKAA